MGLSTLISVVRVDDDGVYTTDVQSDPGGGAVTTKQHFASPGDDSWPLEGDDVATLPGSGSGSELAVGYADTKSEPVAGKGEKRIYSRNADGEVVAAIWLKATGEVVVTDGDNRILLRIDADGNAHLGAETGAAGMSRADRTDAEIERIWQVLTTWTVATNDGGAALKAAAIASKPDVQPTSADKVFGT